MNYYEKELLNILRNTTFFNQRTLASISGHSLGIVNSSMKNLLSEGYIEEDGKLTEKASNEFKAKTPKNAIILAAGMGMRMVPINLSQPKALIKVDNEPLIERQIKQLHEVGITDISVVVGFMKESFEYLIDEYGVDLIVNSDYLTKNNLHSLSLVADKISNTYIIPSDIWCKNNPFSKDELYSWYMVNDSKDSNSGLRVNRKMELVSIKNNEEGNGMIGIAYLLDEDAQIIKRQITKLSESSIYDDAFWEEALYKDNKMCVWARIIKASEAIEINTYEQLRELDDNSIHLKSDALDIIAKTFNVSTKAVNGISVLKKGMTNRSFIFQVDNDKYIMRIPGEGTDRLINRKQEADVYNAIHGTGLCDDPVYINLQNGYKITKFLEGVRTCDADKPEDLKKCMSLLKQFHEMRIQVSHTFDIYKQIEFYESLWNGNDSVYRDYEKTKEKVWKLKNYIDSQEKDFCLTHIDAVPDNFLFYGAGRGEEKLQLTDWEYSGMQDPHVDIAMFCIYSLYNKEQVDRLINIYFENQCDKKTRIKIYCYISACGLLWSNWCEYKRQLGVEFGEYSLRQYRFAKDYYEYVAKEMTECKIVM